MAVTEVVVFPSDWNKLTDDERGEYISSAAERGIVLTLNPSLAANPDQLVVVNGNGEPSVIAAPYYFGPVHCDRTRWEHNLRELLGMDDPCFPNPFRDDPGSIRSL